MNQLKIKQKTKYEWNAKWPSAGLTDKTPLISFAQHTTIETEFRTWSCRNWNLNIRAYCFCFLCKFMKRGDWTEWVYGTACGPLGGPLQPNNSNTAPTATAQSAPTALSPPQHQQHPVTATLLRHRLPAVYIKPVSILGVIRAIQKFA